MLNQTNVEITTLKILLPLISAVLALDSLKRPLSKRLQLKMPL